MQNVIDTDQKLTEALNSGNILVLDQPAKQWLLFENGEQNDVEISITVNVDQFETLESLASAGAIYKNSFMTSNTMMLLSYMSWDVANETQKNEESEFEM